MLKQKDLSLDVGGIPLYVRLNGIWGVHHWAVRWSSGWGNVTVILNITALRCVSELYLFIFLFDHSYSASLLINTGDLQPSAAHPKGTGCDHCFLVIYFTHKNTASFIQAPTAPIQQQQLTKILTRLLAFASCLCMWTAFGLLIHPNDLAIKVRSHIITTTELLS